MSSQVSAMSGCGRPEQRGRRGREVPGALGEPVDDDGAHGMGPLVRACAWRRARRELNAPIAPQTSRTAPIPARPPRHGWRSRRRAAVTRKRDLGPPAEGPKFLP